MIERFCSDDYSDFLTANCDRIDLPFWNIHANYFSKNAVPFASYLDENGKLSVLIGEIASCHDEILLGNANRDTTLCGRIWCFNSIKLLTIWDDSGYMFLHNIWFDRIANILEKKGYSIYDARLVFETDETNNIANWEKRDSYYIYSIPVNEYISKNMSSFNDVVKEYETQKKKNELSKRLSYDKWDNWDYNGQGVGYLGYHLMTRQDENKNRINESFLPENLPRDIKDTLLNNMTSLGNNPAIPDVFDIPFLFKIANERFDDVKQELIDIGTIDDFDDTDINSMLSKLILKCKNIERPYRNSLEKLCVNYVIDLFGIPDDTIDLSVSLVDKIDLNAKSIIIDPITGNDNQQFDDINDLTNIRGEVYKRKILNALCMGESIFVSSDINSYSDEINKISPDLCDLYHKIIALNNYSLFMSDDIGISDKNKSQLGTVNVELGNSGQKIRITAQGVIFPVLLSETINGLMQLFTSHSLPKDPQKANIIIGMSDFVKAEPWNMRIGPSLWLLLSKSFNDITFQDLPYLFKRIASLDIEKFNFLMKEVFAKTKKGRIIMSKICNKAKNDIEYNKFTDKMSKMKVNKSIITDEFINEEEL